MTNLIKLAIISATLLLGTSGCASLGSEAAVVPSSPSTYSITPKPVESPPTKVVPKTTPTPVKTVTPVPQPTLSATPPKKTVQYSNCTEVKAAGKAPITASDPGWDPKFDRDKDGVGCTS